MTTLNQTLLPIIHHGDSHYEPILTIGLLVTWPIILGYFALLTITIPYLKKKQNHQRHQR